MVKYSFSIYDLEYFLLILTRVSCFVYAAPFFGMTNVPTRVKVGISFFSAVLLYQVLTPAEVVEYSTVLGYAVLIIKEAIAGLLIGFGASICTSIMTFAGAIADMEVGLSMVTLFDPASRENISITGAYYQYVLMMMMISTGMYRYLFSAMADSFQLIPVNGVVLRADGLLAAILMFLGDYIMIGFRIVLPIFSVILLLNAILGVLAKVSPQMNMFAVGIQLKILAGLGVMFLTAGLLPGTSDFIFEEMKRMVDAFVGAMQ